VKSAVVRTKPCRSKKHCLPVADESDLDLVAYDEGAHTTSRDRSRQEKLVELRILRRSESWMTRRSSLGVSRAHSGARMADGKGVAPSGIDAVVSPSAMCEVSMSV
jgi:hypothetical protein